jgi:hypothetical protein
MTTFCTLAFRSVMMFLSRSCVIGRGGVTFSICSAMAFASKMPTQIGRTFCPAVSRSRNDRHVGHRVHHQPLDRHFYEHGSPPRLFAAARVIRTGTIRPSHSLGPGKFTTLFPSVRP